MGDSYPYAIYRCADGYLGISILTQGQWAALCQLMDRPDLLTNPRYLTGAERADPAIALELDEIIRAWAATLPAQETFERGQAIRCPVALVPSPTQVLASPQYAARGYWVEYDDPDLGRVRLPGTPFRSVTGGLAEFRPARALGADTAEVLAGLGLDHEARRHLAAAGVLG
jgi:crotonobetainyl-CoA:carnitine CoA-transferase CaiB-like acyl-CoA transferase